MNLEIDPDNLARMAAQGLRLNPPPSEAEIDDVLSRLAQAFGAGEQVVREARRILHSRFSIRMEMGQTIKLEHTPWLGARQAEIDPFFWRRYHELLLRKGWSPLVASTLDRSMYELLDFLGNPLATNHWKRRGLVVGDVQSGKTASYGALICKAADAGYRMVILLAGTLENVRRQTQGRLDEAFVGLDSRDFLARDQLRHKTHIGVGQIDSRRDGVVFTSSEKDFRATTASALNISLRSVSEPVLVVAKKHKRVLSNLATWLRTNNADRDGKIDVPLLLIDDEADNASINTKLRPNQVTAINGAIRELLAVFNKSSYVGFTATPFANIFIDPASTDEMMGDDLFPRDFIHLLEPPSNYVGMNRIFPPSDPDHAEQEEREAWLAGLRTIDDNDHWLAAVHGQDAELGEPPPSLMAALRQFLLTCALRDLRVKHQVEGHETGIHRTMLINVSRFTAVQDAVADQIHLELDQLKQQVRLYGRLNPVEASTRSVEIAALEEEFRQEFDQCGFEWGEVLAELHDAISPIEVRPVNQRTGAASLDYTSIKEAPGLRVVAVGGNSLSRGLTLEGLCVSYFLRNVGAYDTLLQMGRWFGYRDGYGDLCRIWLSEDAEGWYRHVTRATDELKRDFARMRRQQAKPAEFGLRVRRHPDTLLITARNKMATGIDVVGEVRDISLAGRGIETARLYADNQRNEENLRIVDRFLSDLIDRHGEPHQSRTGNAAAWQQVPADFVGNLLRTFLVHPLNHDFQGEAIADFLSAATERSDPALSHWTVALPTNGSLDPVPLESGIQLRAKERRVLFRDQIPQSLLISGKKARVGGREDVLHGLSPEQVEIVRENARLRNIERKAIAEDEYRAAMSHPLLVIYLLQGYQAPKENPKMKVPYRNGLFLPAVALHFPGSRDLNAPTEIVRYRLNKVAQAELELEGDDWEDEEPDDD